MFSNELAERFYTKVLFVYQRLILKNGREKCLDVAGLPKMYGAF
jgi:hypothetical protein